MAGLVKAPLVTDTMPPVGARDGGWLTELRTTPGRLRAGVALVVLLACGLGLLTGMVFAALESGFTAIGGHDAPLVEQSNALYYAVSDMDAQVGNVLLTGSDPALAADQHQDLTLYASDQQHAEQDLQQVAVTAAANPAAQRAVSSVLDALGRYEALAADAILVNQRGHDPAGRPSAATLSYFQQATDLMSTTVLPAATSLTMANASALDKSYNQDRSTATSGQVLVVVLGLAVAGTLLGIQVFLAARFRRLVNPALAAATVLAVGLAIAGAVQLGAQAGNLKVASQDAFDSILALTQARAVSYDANADETRFLVDPGRAAAYQDAFVVENGIIRAVGLLELVERLGDEEGLHAVAGDEREGASRRSRGARATGTRRAAGAADAGRRVFAPDLHRLGEAPADLVEHQANDGPRARQVARRHDQVEADRPVGVHEVGDPEVAADVFRAMTGIAVEAQARHGGGEDARALVVGLVEHLARGLGDDRVRARSAGAVSRASALSMSVCDRAGSDRKVATPASVLSLSA